MATFHIMLDFGTYVHPEIEDVWIELNFVPYPDMNIYVDRESGNLPAAIGEGAYFKVVDLDYLLKDNVFVASLMLLDDFLENKKGEE